MLSVPLKRTFVPAAKRDRYEQMLAEVMRRYGDAVNVEQVLHDLAEAGEPPAACDISGFGWWEVDNAEDHATAEKALANP